MKKNEIVVRYVCLPAYAKMRIYISELKKHGIKEKEALFWIYSLIEYAISNDFEFSASDLLKANAIYSFISTKHCTKAEIEDKLNQLLDDTSLFVNIGAGQHKFLPASIAEGKLEAYAKKIQKSAEHKQPTKNVNNGYSLFDVIKKGMSENWGDDAIAAQIKTISARLYKTKKLNEAIKQLKQAKSNTKDAEIEEKLDFFIRYAETQNKMLNLNGLYGGNNDCLF